MLSGRRYTKRDPSRVSTETAAGVGRVLGAAFAAPSTVKRSVTEQRSRRGFPQSRWV